MGAAVGRGRAAWPPRPVNDMWVAACCPAADVPLLTYNRSDFEDFRQFHGLQMLPAGGNRDEDARLIIQRTGRSTPIAGPALRWNCRCQGAYPSPALVFRSPEGNQVRSGNLRRHHWAPAVALAGLDRCTLHDMRARRRESLCCCRRLGPGGGEVGRTQLGGVHQEPLRPPFPRARRGAGPTGCSPSSPLQRPLRPPRWCTGWCTSADPDVHKTGSLTRSGQAR